MWGHNMCGGVSHIVWMCVCGCGCERVIMNVNVGVHMGICVWALTVRKYDCMCVRVVHFRAHCMSEHECVCYCSVPESCLTLRSHGRQHARLPCPSLSPWVCSNSCPLSWWCHPTISSSSSPSPPALNLSQHQGLCQWVSSSHQVAKVLEFQLQCQSFQWIFRTEFFWDELVGSPCSPRDSQESPPTQFKSINSSALSFLHSPNLISIHDHWKNHSLD